MAASKVNWTLENWTLTTTDTHQDGEPIKHFADRDKISDEEVECVTSHRRWSYHADVSIQSVVACQHHPVNPNPVDSKSTIRMKKCCQLVFHCDELNLRTCSDRWQDVTTRNFMVMLRLFRESDLRVLESLTAKKIPWGKLQIRQNIMTGSFNHKNAGKLLSNSQKTTRKLFISSSTVIWSALPLSHKTALSTLAHRSTAKLLRTPSRRTYTFINSPEKLISISMPGAGRFLQYSAGEVNINVLISFGPPYCRDNTFIKWI